MRLLAAVVGFVAVWLIVDPVAERRLVRSPQGRPWTELHGWILTLGRRIVGAVGVGPSARRTRARERTRVVQALAALAAELESGQSPASALEHAGGVPTVWPAASAARRLGGDVVAALRVDATSRPLLDQLAACWQVGSRTGSGLAASVARLVESARAGEDVRVQLEAQLAAPRATARMLGGLPMIGLGFGILLGSDPLRWLFGTPLGMACLVLGLALTAVGTSWTGRIARRVEALL